jgi:outer membrane protein assembly factor BamB
MSAGNRVLLCTLFLTIFLLPARAGQWMTYGGNPQRDGWARDETILTQENVKAMKLIWKIQIDSPLRELNSLRAPLVAEGILTAQGHKDIVVVAGGADTVDAVDVDTGKLLWHKQFTQDSQPSRRSGWLCPNALNPTPVIQTGGISPRDRTVLAISADGKLHALNIVNGEDRTPPVDFVPPFSKSWSLNLVDNVLYTTISQGCNGAKSGVSAMDLKDPKHPVSFFQSDTIGGGVWGRGGVAFGPDNKTVYAGTGDGPFDAAAGKYGNTVLALSPKDLKLKDYYTPTNWVFLNRKDLDLCVTPVVFRYKNWELLVAGGKEGRLTLLDVKQLGGATHQDPLFQTPVFLNEDLYSAGRGFWGSFTTWEDKTGTRWIYAPGWGPLASNAPPFAVKNGEVTEGALMAFKVEEKEGKPVLTPAWISRNMNVPESAIVANGIVYVVSSGENTMQADAQGRLMDSEQRLKTATGHAILYALDAATGRELYNSGDQMPAITHFNAIAMSNGRIYVTTIDAKLYAFGLEGQ